MVPLVPQVPFPEGERMAPIRDDQLVQLKVRVPEKVRRQLKVYAAMSGTPMHQLVTDALTALLKRKGVL